MRDNANILDAEKILSQHILAYGSDLTRQNILECVDTFRPVLSSPFYNFQQDEDFEALIKSLETRYNTTMGAGVSLVDHNVQHDKEWYLKREIEIKWEYWEDYKSHLISQDFSASIIGSMDSVTDKIVGLLKDPFTDGEWCRKGMVIGHVQSGKTANYIGLLSKAADAGYKFIIVIAGIHNNLRTQTQERIDEGFLGFDSETREPIGVGCLRPNRSQPVTVTTTKNDFNSVLAKRMHLQLNSLNKTFILVIKKNVNTLSSLHSWLRELNTKEGEKITDIPMLLIDDEADNASINTNKPENDPTRINKEIRGILNLFKKRCYVGYTATPFANIFIDPDTQDDDYGEDLFPKDFIYCLDAPTNYFGSQKLFSDEEGKKEFIREIDDAEEYIPLRHKRNDQVHDLPPSLKKAIRTFILIKAIRNLRGQENKHTSMMINVSRFVNTQREIKQLTESYVSELTKTIRFNYKLPVSEALKTPLIAQIYQNFNEEFENIEFEWNQVVSELKNAADATKTFLINGSSDEVLDYRSYSKEGNSLTAIAIGGLSLSRGLTIEGLVVSYIYRNSKMYDTLLQMGRWFGYRNGYEDLCRVYMSEASYGWYFHISEATEELRGQIKRMRRDGKTPSDFGLYVRAHPDSLIVTALNKMRNTDNRSLKVSYDGKLIETYILPEAEEKNNKNRELLKQTYQDLQKSHPTAADETNSYLFMDISWDKIQDLVFRFQFHNDMFDLKESVPQFIQKISDLYPKWDVIFKSLKGERVENEYMIAAQKRTVGLDISKKPRQPVSEKGWYLGNKNRFSGNSMFKIGLNSSDIQKAQELAETEDRKKPIYRDYTNIRNKPVLMLHLLNLVDGDENSEPVISLVPGLSINIPNSSEFRTVEYTVGPVWLKQYEADRYDAPEDEEDFEFE